MDRPSRRAQAPDSLNPFTSLTPADRIPSHGVQLSADGTADITSRGTARPTFGSAPARSGPATLNLWDRSADSLPETWSTDR